MKEHDIYMTRCFTLAKKGGKNTQLNPNVGCVIVYKKRIIGEGYHKRMGDNHAEVNAINSVSQEDKHLIEHATLYVSLEPCNHTGKTPACTHLIIASKIKHVVISCKDSHPLVNGSGIDWLQSNGVKVEVGILEKEGKQLITPFEILIALKRPYVILKYAQSKDGYISKKNEQTAISQSTTQVLSHRWRTEIDAIMVGTNTVMIDNPSLTSRAYKGDNPVRIILDRTGKIGSKNIVISDKNPSIVFTELVDREEGNCEFINIKFDDELLPNILSILYARGIYLIMIEGGAKLLRSFIQQQLWDEARVITSNYPLGDGLRAPSITGKLRKSYYVGKDKIQIIVPTKIT